MQLSFVFLGLSITSSWGNGHATTYRGLLRELRARGHRVCFLERDLPFYAQHRDLPQPPYAETHLYQSLDELKQGFARMVSEADVVVVGSYVPDGVEVGDWVRDTARGLRMFYDIDTPVTLHGLETGETQYLTRRQIPEYDIYLSFTGGPTLNRLSRHYGARSVRLLPCSVDPALYHPLEVEQRWDLGYLGTHSPDRQRTLELFLLDTARCWQSGRFVVAGAQYPSDIEWPTNVEHIEHLPPAEHASFYCAERFTLNLTRAEMLRAGYSPSVRLFEAAAAGVPIISDSWPGVQEFFAPGTEILIARERRDVMTHLLETSEDTRRSVARRARARVLAEHTAAHRAEALENFARRARSRALRRTLPASLSREGAENT